MRRAKSEIRRTKKAVDFQIRKRRHTRDDEGRVVIPMNVKDDSNFLSVFSETDTPIISETVANFIEASTASVLPKEPLTLRIYSHCIDDFEKTLYRQAISEYYFQKYTETKRELRRSYGIVLSLAFLGILVLLCEFVFEYHIGNPVWAEVIDIVAWVLLWESVDIGFFENRAARRKSLRYLSYLSMKIEYFPDKESKPETKNREV